MSSAPASTTSAALTAPQETAIAAALARIPPLWPLTHFVAVNPFVGLVGQPFASACDLLQRTLGAAPLQPLAEYRRAFAAGEIEPADLAAVARAPWTPAKLQAAFAALADEPASPVIPTVADWLDQARPRAHWSAFVIDEISKWCAVTFDENQTTWNSPWQTVGLYRAWREAAVHDRNPEAFGLAGFRAFVASLPAEADAALAHCLGLLQPWPAELADFLHRQVATIAGWAGYVQYRVREDALRGRANPALRELLAIRLAYDAALLQAFAGDPRRSRWGQTPTGRAEKERHEVLTLWQCAYEAGYQRRLARALAAQNPTAPTTRPVAQAIFCIDVRSEVFRRHFEAALPGVQTIGFAGFFGFPVAHASAGNGAAAARCPVLLVPPVNSADALTTTEAEAAVAARAEAGAWKAFQNSAASCFFFVETVGLAFGAALGRGAQRNAPACARVAPAPTSVSLETRAGLAAGALRNMGLTRNFARLVLVCGHGSQSANNPHASSLDCGACGGHAGDVNARLAVATLNDPAVRTLLAAQGLAIPADTWFLAGLHQTTTDDVVLFDLESVPGTHLVDLVNLRLTLARAGAAARRERAPGLGLGGLPDAGIDGAVRARAADIAQVRPEWGLANNAAFIAAPRRRTAGLKLDGRVFLHDYDAAADTDSALLTLILSAPVVVPSWINLQYYASRVDPERYGAGNKVLHNVVGGIGVLEGNGGDLKTGLSWQSIHDGERFMHEPRRLAVYIEASPEKIGAVLAAQPAVRQLFDHGWLHLWSIDGDRCLKYDPVHDARWTGQWLPGTDWLG
ncbi:MAG: DUF2309 domain-containing protein [Verrucomicrobia bacterium]|nr:DUF2309 domain-containing protein [Verrucomicrobiota bacterium]